MQSHSDVVNIVFVEHVPENGAEPDKCPVLLLHGLTSSKEDWNGCIPQLLKETGRKVIQLDARNHGDSGWSDTFSYDAMSDDLLRLMQSLDISRALLIGHSMGGRMGMNFALQHPAMVEGLVVEDISKHVPKRMIANVKNVIFRDKVEAVQRIPPHITDLDEARRFLSSYIREKTPQQFRSDRHDASSFHELPIRPREGGGFEWKTNFEGIKKAMEKTKNGDIEDSETEGAQFTGPTLFIYGGKSSLDVPSDKECLLQTFPNAEFEAVEGSTHYVHIEYPDEYLEKVTRFINKHAT